MANYPNAIYEGEVVDSKTASKNPKKFKDVLSVELLEKHIAFSEKCKDATK